MPAWVKDMEFLTEPLEGNKANFILQNSQRLRAYFQGRAGKMGQLFATYDRHPPDTALDPQSGVLYFIRTEEGLQVRCSLHAMNNFAERRTRCAVGPCLPIPRACFHTTRLTKQLCVSCACRTRLFRSRVWHQGLPNTRGRWHGAGRPPLLFPLAHVSHAESGTRILCPDAHACLDGHPILQENASKKVGSSLQIIQVRPYQPERRRDRACYCYLCYNLFY
jgi:hypothetical protein